ncbi:MAG: hypothetical protein ACYC5G_03395 [Candidatus Doudnabacteria bacterium]
MKLWKLVVVLVLVLLSFYFVFYKVQNKNRQQETVKQWLTQTDEQGPVLVKVTPVDLGRNANQWRFTVTFTTHSEELDQDPMKAVSLIDDKGNVYNPLYWEGPGPGGHHIEGTMIFNKINPVPKYIELRIKDIGGVPERYLKWEIEENLSIKDDERFKGENL